MNLIEDIIEDIIAYKLGKKAGGGSGGGGGKGSDTLAEAGVHFIDYDGTLLKSITPDKVAGLTKLPKNPTHEGLTAQGWNWSLADIKSYMATYPDAAMTIGQMYTTDDGKTRFVLDLEKALTMSLMIQQSVSNGVTIDWGDGADTETIDGTGIVQTSHSYAVKGIYTISLSVAEGCTLDFGGNISDTYYNVLALANADIRLREIHIGNGVTGIAARGFASLLGLARITIPQGVISIEDRAFNSCYGLVSLTLPNAITSVAERTFYGCRSLQSISIPHSVTQIAQMAFNTSSSLRSLALPSSLTSIPTSAFSGCPQLRSLTIPNGVTSIGQGAFNNSNQLKKIVIPNQVTSIAESAFASSITLRKLTISESVTSIGANAFSSCQSLTELIVLAQTPPTISNANAFQMMAFCTIYVPHGKGATYKAASIWSGWASQIQELPE